jgi:riboflavin kinase / FMN adenylyltransferase
VNTSHAARSPRPTVLTIGNFDGVHLGHRALIDRTVALAQTLDAPAVVLTFDPHPAALLRPDRVPAALQSVTERSESLRVAGIDEVVVLAFDAELAALEPEAFITELLVGRLGVRAVVVGENFRFGRGARGDVALLTRLGSELGFAVEAVPLVAGEAAVLSSTAIRAALAEGDVAAVARALGRPFTLTGEVVVGEGRGRTLGIPTANVAVPPGRALPADGVYACEAWTGAGQRFAAVTNIGRRPTFDGVGRTVEAHLLDAPADLDLYGAPVTLAFRARIRGEERFAGPEALIARIRADIAIAREELDRPEGR